MSRAANLLSRESDTDKENNRELEGGDFRDIAQLFTSGFVECEIGECEM